MKLRATLLFTLLGLQGCFIPFSGGQLTGEITRVPSDWGALAQEEVVQLETNPEAPYSVNLWVIGMGNILYVHAGANRATWVEHIEVNPNVRLKIKESIYELSAVRVKTAEEFTRFSDAYEGKYGNPPRNENVTEAYLFRLHER